MALVLRGSCVLVVSTLTVGLRVGETPQEMTTKECGKWGWSGTCTDLAQCAYKPTPTDELLNDSCRKRECKDVKFEGEVFENRMWGKFRNWGDTVDTCSPWVMPINETEIREILQFARDNEYKVRVVGASHSTGGLVTEPEDEKVIVVSLANYVSDVEFSMKNMTDGSRRAVVNAGWTLVDLYEKIRPDNFFLPAQSAGGFFSLAGVIANSVHGGSYLHGFVHGYVTGLRVMDADGTITWIKDEEDLRAWRNSFGLLGVILNIEFQLEKREKLEMDVIQENLTEWSSEALWNFIKEKAEANLPVNTPNDVPDDGGAIHGEAFNGEFFVDFLNGDKPLMGVYSQKANKSATNGSGAPAHVAFAYAAAKGKETPVEGHGNMTWGEAARRMGAPPLTIPGTQQAFEYRILAVSKMFSKETIGTVDQYVAPMKAAFNDGFIYMTTPVVVEVAYFVKPEQAFQCMDIIKEVQREYAHDGSDFLFAVPGEFRFINAQDRAVLQPVPEGLWFNCQLLIYPDFAKNDQAWKGALKKVEDRWRNELNGKPHLGKIFGLSGEAGNVKAFSKDVACKVYTDEQKAKFKEARTKWDPKGLFESGLGMKLVEAC